MTIEITKDIVTINKVLGVRRIKCPTIICGYGDAYPSDKLSFYYKIKYVI